MNNSSSASIPNGKDGIREIVIMFFNVVGLAPIAFIAKLVSNWNTRTQSTR